MCLQSHVVILETGKMGTENIIAPISCIQIKMSVIYFLKNCKRQNGKNIFSGETVKRQTL